MATPGEENNNESESGNLVCYEENNGESESVVCYEEDSQALYWCRESLYQTIQ